MTEADFYRDSFLGLIRWLDEIFLGIEKFIAEWTIPAVIIAGIIFMGFILLNKSVPSEK